MGKILISYRRNDSPDVSGRIYDRLVTQYGKEAVFKDVDSIPLGVDFRTYLDEQVAQCSVFLAVIGRDWIKKKGSRRQSNLEDPKDFVRIEIESALNHQIPIIPVLVRGAIMPEEKSLPDSIKVLHYRNGIAVRSDPDFHHDMNRLIEHLTTHMKSLGTSVAQSSLESPAQATRVKVALAIVPKNMVLIPKGPFLYGDDKVKMTIEEDYCMDVYPVTNEAYRKFFEGGGYHTREYWSDEGWAWKEKEKVFQPGFWDDPIWDQLHHPVVGVGYFEAEAFAKWAGNRLPTEQEWEKAARGTDGRGYPWGEEFGENRCNSNESNIGATTPVKKYPNGTSPFDCHDMAGNVWEWTNSWGDNSHKYRVIRGGSWFDDAKFLRSSYRNWNFPTNWGPNVGFRCAQDAP